MEKVLKYRQILTEFMQARVARQLQWFPPRFSRCVTDTENDIYMHLYYEWKDGRYRYGVLVHFDIIDGKVWLQRNITEDDLLDELEAAGIPKSDFVLGTVSPSMRHATRYATG